MLPGIARITQASIASSEMTNCGGDRHRRYEYENWRSASLRSDERDSETCSAGIERDRSAASEHLRDDESGKECGREVAQHVHLSCRRSPPTKYDGAQRLDCHCQSAQ